MNLYKYYYITKLNLCQVLNKQMINKCYKFRIYPTKEQEQLFAQFFGAKRWIYNHYLALNKDRFAKKEKHLSNFDINLDITNLKKLSDTSWLRSIDDWCLKHAAEDLAIAYTNFFKSITGKSKQNSKIPVFKSKSNKQSYRTRNIKISENFISVPKIKNIKTKIHRKMEGVVKFATISKNPDGIYYISVLTEQEQTVFNSTNKEIGIDLGISDLCILSNGIKFTKTSNLLKKTNLALKLAQKKLSKKSKGSNNYEKQRIKVAKLYSKLTRIKEHYYHEISNYLVKNFDALYLENLNIKGMIKNRKLSRAIHEISWYKLISMIQYKSSWYGRTFHQINRFTATSKKCSHCNHKLDNLSLSTRSWTCPNCRTNHDRDINAAINILYTGQTDVYNCIIPQETGGMGLLIPGSLQKYCTKNESSI